MSGHHGEFCRRRHLGQARHGHDAAADDHHETRRPRRSRSSLTLMRKPRGPAAQLRLRPTATSAFWRRKRAAWRSRVDSAGPDCARARAIEIHSLGSVELAASVSIFRSSGHFERIEEAELAPAVLLDDAQHGLGKIHRPFAAARIMVRHHRLHALATRKTG